MNAATEVLKLLAEWRQCSEGERHGILSDDWDEVSRHQDNKSRLTGEITLALNRFHTSPFAGEAAEQIRLGGSELIVLEQRNQELLRTRREERTLEREAASETCRNLQGVRRAYGSSNTHLWQSYS